MLRLSRFGYLLRLALLALALSLALVPALAMGCNETGPPPLELTTPATVAPVATALIPGATSRSTPDIDTDTEATSGGLKPLDPVVAFPYLDSMSNMVHLTHAGDGTGRLYLVLQKGMIVSLDPLGEEKEPSLFLDISDRVTYGGEQGLLGLAFDPDYASNGHFYVNYTSKGHTVLARYTAGRADAGPGDPDSELVIMRIRQPYPNHNGGTLAFGHDGYLYIGLGDGGAGGDPLDSGQDLQTLLGAMLRIDVSQASNEQTYAIPADNPFVHDDARPEIWAYGLRNPWRFSFDRETGDLWAGDVGQNNWEEVDLLQAGKNYGWNRMEGTHCFPSTVQDCDDTGSDASILETDILEPPIIDYPLSGPRCSVIGGVVYRGPSLPWLKGAYLFADYCSGELWALRYDGVQVTEHALLGDSVRRISAFGEDKDGEVYLLSFDGYIYRLAEAQ